MLHKELVEAQNSLAIETGIQKFIEWIRSGKLEVTVSGAEHPRQDLHHDPRKDTTVRIIRRYV